MLALQASVWITNKYLSGEQREIKTKIGCKLFTPAREHKHTPWRLQLESCSFPLNVVMSHNSEPHRCSVALKVQLLKVAAQVPANQITVIQTQVLPDTEELLLACPYLGLYHQCSCPLGLFGQLSWHVKLALLCVWSGELWLDVVITVIVSAPSVGHVHSVKQLIQTLDFCDIMKQR